MLVRQSVAFSRGEVLDLEEDQHGTVMEELCKDTQLCQAYVMRTPYACQAISGLHSSSFLAHNFFGTLSECL